MTSSPSPAGRDIVALARLYRDELNSDRGEMARKVLALSRRVEELEQALLDIADQAEIVNLWPERDLRNIGVIARAALVAASNSGPTGPEKEGTAWSATPSAVSPDRERGS